MLAEIHLLRLQTLLRSNAPSPNSASQPRFAPIASPRS